MIKLIFCSYYPFPQTVTDDENEIQLVCLKTKVISNRSVTV